MAKNQAYAKQHPEPELCYLKIIHILHPSYQPKIVGHILKNKQNNKYVCIYEIIRLIIMKMKMKNRSHRYNINRFRSTIWHKCSKYKKSLSMMMLTYIKQYLSNICSSHHERTKQHCGWVEKTEILGDVFKTNFFIKVNKFFLNKLPTLRRISVKFLSHPAEIIFFIWRTI